MDHIAVVQEAPEEHEGLRSCLMTGHPEGPYVQLGYTKSAPNLGWILLSAKYATWIARAIGWVPEEEAQQLRDDLAASRAEIDQLKEQLGVTGLDAEKVDDAGRVLDAFMQIVDITAKRLDVKQEA